MARSWTLTKRKDWWSQHIPSSFFMFSKRFYISSLLKIDLSLLLTSKPLSHPATICTYIHSLFIKDQLFLLLSKASLLMNAPKNTFKSFILGMMFYKPVVLRNHLTSPFSAQLNFFPNGHTVFTILEILYTILVGYLIQFPPLHAHLLPASITTGCYSRRVWAPQTWPWWSLVPQRPRAALHPLLEDWSVCQGWPIITWSGPYLWKC